MNGARNDTEQTYTTEESTMDYEMPPAPTKTRNRRLPYKSASLATVLSLMPGLGQIYVGYYTTGFQFVVIPAGIIALLASGHAKGLEPFLGMFIAFFWIFNMIDAYRRATHYNLALDGLSGENVPEDFEMPGAKGSVPAGVILVAIGILAILDLNFGVSLEWMENWWPLALIGFGAWLIFKSRSKAD